MLLGRARIGVAGANAAAGASTSGRADVIVQGWAVKVIDKGHAAITVAEDE